MVALVHAVAAAVACGLGYRYLPALSRGRTPGSRSPAVPAQPGCGAGSGSRGAGRAKCPSPASSTGSTAEQTLSGRLLILDHCQLQPFSSGTVGRIVMGSKRSKGE